MTIASSLRAAMSTRRQMPRTIVLSNAHAGIADAVQAELVGISIETHPAVTPDKAVLKDAIGRIIGVVTVREDC